MTSAFKLKWLSAFFLCISFLSATAQTKEDLFTGMEDITWLGFDFTQAKFIGSATNFKDAGEVTNQEFRDKFIPAWNNLVVNEPKKYDLSKPTHRTEVKYAISATESANSKIKKDFFSNDPGEYNSLDESKVAALVKGYDFKGKTGIGLIIFIEGMSKGKEQASGWAAYVDMGKKSVIMSSHVTGKPGGFGFRNYWAKAFASMIKDADYKDWK